MGHRRPPGARHQPCCRARYAAPGRFEMETTSLAYLSPHSLARRLQRAEPGDEALKTDLAGLAHFALDEVTEREIDGLQSPGAAFTVTARGRRALGRRPR